jgi:hypothetical protein
LEVIEGVGFKINLIDRICKTPKNIATSRGDG